MAAGKYLVAIPQSEFAASGPLAGWSATIQPVDAAADGANDGNVRPGGGMTSATITVGGTAPVGESPNNADDLADGRTDLTIDFGLSQWSLGNQLWFDTVENGIFEPGEEGIANAVLYLYVDVNDDGKADDADGDGKLTAVDAVATTTSDAAGRYRFDGLGAGTYIVAVADSTMRGQLKDWTVSRFSRIVEPGVDNDSNATGWVEWQVHTAPIRIGDGPAVDLTLDLGFEPQFIPPIVWPDFDLTGFGNRTSFGGGGAPGFFSPGFGDGFDDFDGFDGFDGFDDFGDIDLFETDESFDFVGDEFFDSPTGPLAYTGSNSRTLVSWAAMLIVFGAVLVGVSREPDED